MGFFFTAMPVAEPSGGDADDGFKGFVGVVGEVAVVPGGDEEAMPESVDVSLGEGGAVGEVGVAGKIMFKAPPGGFSVSGEEVVGGGVSG